jgi:nucleoid-associated protein YgaU
MANLNGVLQQLRDEHKQAQSKVEKLKEAISVIEGLVGRNSAISHKGTPPTRTVSGVARRRMAQAQRARWARVKNGSQAGSLRHTSNASPAKRTMSLAARRKIAAAQRARWAQVRAKQGKKAA